MGYFDDDFLEPSYKTKKSTVLWSTSLKWQFALPGFVQVADLKNPPTAIDPKNIHIIIKDGTTSEALVLQTIYRIVEAGGIPQLYSSKYHIDYLSQDIPSTGAKLVEYYLEHCIDYRDYLFSLKDKDKKIDIEAARDVAAVILKYSQSPILDLEILRERTSCKSFDWNNIVKEIRTNIIQANKNKNKEEEDDPDLKLKLELQLLAKEPDYIKRVRKKAEICVNYSIPKHEIDNILKYSTRQTQVAERKTYDIDELFAMESEGLSYLIPEMLPRGETIILGAMPKTGKSLLGVDIAFAVATGEDSFLGHNLPKGKVLLVSVDESLNSTKAKLLKRGFRSHDKGSIRVIDKWTIDEVERLEKELEDFRPDLVIIDSLKRINHGSPISENSAEFADNIYTLKELISKYNASGVLIHHTNKDREALGVYKMRGSSAIGGAVWGNWILEHIPKQDPQTKKLSIDPKDPKRLLHIYPRDAEGQTLSIEFNPENNSWSHIVGKVDEESLTNRERILRILGYNPDGLTGRGIIECLEMTPEEGRGVYTELSRMVNKKLITCKPMADNRSNLYMLPTNKKTQQPSVKVDPPSPPPPSEELLSIIPESIDVQDFEDTQQDTQQPEENTQQPFEENDLLNTPKSSTNNSCRNNTQQPRRKGGGGGSTFIDDDPDIGDPIVGF